VIVYQSQSQTIACHNHGQECYSRQMNSQSCG